MKAKPKSAPNAKVEREPKYSAWKADKIRVRLNNYRIVNRTGDNLLPISAVLDRMLGSPKLSDFPRTRSGALDIDDEWMRRFTVGKSGLIFERVDALRLFLIDEGFLTNEELVEDDYGEMLAIYGYLANNSPRVQAIVERLPEPYVIASSVSYDEDVIILEFGKIETGSLLLVEESHAVEVRALKGMPGVKDWKRKRLRKGYAFFSTRMNLLHVFLCGSTPLDRVNYFQVEAYVLPEGSPELFLIRVGLPSRNADSVFRGPAFRGGKSTLESCNIRKFGPLQDVDPGTVH